MIPGNWKLHTVRQTIIPYAIRDKNRTKGTFFHRLFSSSATKTELIFAAQQKKFDLIDFPSQNTPIFLQKPHFIHKKRLVF
jgi:hypothetical protein